MSGEEVDVTALVAAERPWEPEIELDEPAVRALLARALPGFVDEVAEGSAERLVIAPLGAGWDNAAFLVGRDDADPCPWVFRFPRRTLAAELIQNEVAVLPALAGRLPVDVPVPEHAAHDPTGEYPWLIAGYRRLPGETACRASLDDEARARLAAPLGALLRALHDTPAEIARLAPVDPLEKGDVHRRAGPVLEQIDRLADVAPAAWLDGARALCRRMPDVPLYRPLVLSEEDGGEGAGEAPLVLLHGDLYARHLLVEEGRLRGVIDWGDVHRGDPAVDLSIAYSFLLPPARGAFFSAYGAIDDATEARARFKAMHYGVVLWRYGLDVGDEPLVAAGRYALEASLT